MEFVLQLNVFILGRVKDKYVMQKMQECKKFLTPVQKPVTNFIYLLEDTELQKQDWS